jgi:putative two-component system response regulator
MAAATDFAPPKSRFFVLVVDDDELNRRLTSDMLRINGYEVADATNALEAREQIDRRHPDLVLMDVMMPGKTGIEMCRELKEDPKTRLIPVVLVTGLTDREAKLKGIEAGADDFLNKPVDPQELFARVKSLLKVKQFTDELENAETVLFSLALGVEARDPYTEGHCHRLSQYAAQLGARMELPDADIVALRRGGVLHDIGKIGVSDSILKKPSELDQQEWDVMRQHPVIGEQICHPLRSLTRVLPIIRHHHEHWNGHGYPDGLVADEIPLLARILQVVDAYDALTTDRPYKPALSHEEATRILLRESDEGWWDAAVMRAFLQMMNEKQRKAG